MLVNCTILSKRVQTQTPRPTVASLRSRSLVLRWLRVFRCCWTVAACSLSHVSGPISCRGLGLPGAKHGKKTTVVLFSLTFSYNKSLTYKYAAPSISCGLKRCRSCNFPGQCSHCVSKIMYVIEFENVYLL